MEALGVVSSGGASVRGAGSICGDERPGGVIVGHRAGRNGIWDGDRVSITLIKPEGPGKLVTEESASP
jgi:hypothetical protein